MDNSISYNFSKVAPVLMGLSDTYLHAI